MDPFLEPRNDLTDLPKPGEIVIYDYTDERERPLEEKEEAFEVRAVQWNIERAYKLDGIIDLLSCQKTKYRDVQVQDRRSLGLCRRRLCGAEDHFAYSDFDVLAIQEFDISCARSKYRNSADELARAMKMKCIFVCEFEELFSTELRTMRSQGGGVHGNGLLTWWDVERVEVIEHVKIFDWEADGGALNEPRRGNRRSLAVFLKHPHHPNRKMLVYSVHLEVFCGIFGRLRQFSQILGHSKLHSGTHPHQLILGDLNTMAHGLARLLPKYCCDAMRWRSVGWSEAAWWQRNLFNVTPNLSNTHNHFLAAHYHPKRPFEREIENEEDIEDMIEEKLEEKLEDKIEENIEDMIEEKIKEIEDIEDIEDIDIQDNNMNNQNIINKNSRPIFSKKELSNLINPFFFCPFSVSKDKTVEMHGYSGKLDWMLLRGWRVLDFGLDNDLYLRSDHKLLWTRIAFYDSPNDPAQGAYEAHNSAAAAKTPIRILPIHDRKRVLFIGAAVGVVLGVAFYYILQRD